MTTTAITGTGSSTEVSAADAMKKTIGMNKDDFLKLFIAQLQNQDPLNPQDPTEMLGQLAQMTQVEQAYNTAATLNKLLEAQNSSFSMSSLGTIGKNISALGNQVYFDGTNQATLEFSMSAATSSTNLDIRDASGRTVKTVQLGTQYAGSNQYAWDGKDGQGNLLAPGSYSFSVSGTDASGATQKGTTYTTGKADGVVFDNGVAHVSIGTVLVPFSSVFSVRET